MTASPEKETAPRATKGRPVTQDRDGDSAKPADGKDELPVYPNGRYYPDPPKLETTLGKSLFFDPLAGQASLGDLRARLELKYAACLLTGGTNHFPLHVGRIKNLKLRALAAAGMVFKNWSARDLMACTDGLEGPADSVLLATLEKPKWGPHDFHLMECIERLENLQSFGLGGGRML